MEYRNLGPTGLKVSAVGFGNWLTSDDKDAQARTTEMIKVAYENGINFFDTAEAYANGQAEIFMGNAFKELKLAREQLVVSTKLFGGGVGPNDVGLSRKHVIEGTINSLKRLQLDYVDIVFCHRPDDETPVEETCRAFAYLINTGKVLYWGTSEWPADKIAEAYTVCDRLGLPRPVVEQPEYSMLVRNRFEKEYYYLFKEQKMGSTIWSPMAGGILSGKYNEEVPKGSRFDSENARIKTIYKKYFPTGSEEKARERLRGIGEIAKELGVNQATLALAWTLANRNVSVCMFGATTAEQIKENVKAVEVSKKLTPEILERIEKILDNAPDQAPNFRQFFRNIRMGAANKQ